MYYQGLGIIQCYEKAFEWLSKAAEQEDMSAQYSLGTMYDNGYGVVKNIVLAKEWYSKAANNGHAQAQLVLDEMQ